MKGECIICSPLFLGLSFLFGVPRLNPDLLHIYREELRYCAKLWVTNNSFIKEFQRIYDLLLSLRGMLCE